MKFSCVVLAGGNGIRFGSKKQFMEWNGKPLWKYAFDVCRRVSDDVIVVGVDIPGGDTRQKSVFNGICKVKENRVVIVEAARPLVTPEQIKVIAEVDWPSVSYAIDSSDTILYHGMYLYRKYCLRLQVPQAFDTDLLLEAHKNNTQCNPTDDTVLVKNYSGIDPEIIAGGLNLLKVTYQQDLQILEALL